MLVPRVALVSSTTDPVSIYFILALSWGTLSVLEPCFFTFTSCPWLHALPNSMAHMQALILPQQAMSSCIGARIAMARELAALLNSDW